jgi:hypothetical protein
MSVGLLAVEWLDSKRQLAVQLQRHATATCPVRGYVCGIWSCSEKGGSCLLSVGLQRCTCGCGVSCACSGCGMLTCMCSSSTNGSNVRSGRQLAWLLHQEASPEGHLWVPCVAGMAGGGGGLRYLGQTAVPTLPFHGTSDYGSGLVAPGGPRRLHSSMYPCPVLCISVQWERVFLAIHAAAQRLEPSLARPMAWPQPLALWQAGAYPCVRYPRWWRTPLFPSPAGWW